MIEAGIPALALITKEGKLDSRYRRVLITHTTISPIYNNIADFWATEPCLSTEAALPYPGSPENRHYFETNPSELS